MKVKASFVKNIRIKGEYIKLDSLLKHASLVMTGGEAKELIKSGEVRVGGEPVTERGRKIRDGMIVSAMGTVLRVVSDEATPPAAHE